MYPEDLRYTRDHEWLRLEGGEATVGITDYAQGELGDIVFVELPEVGAQLKRSDTFAIVESVKAASDVYSPLSGEVAATNAELVEEPELANEDPYGTGWMIRIRPNDVSEFDELFDAAGYEALMIEPTETESIETLDRFIDAMRQIADEAQNEPRLLLEAPRPATGRD